MSRAECEAALGRAKSALAEARRALPKECRQNPEASVAWRVEQAQRNVTAAIDHYYPIVKDGED